MLIYGVFHLARMLLLMTAAIHTPVCLGFGMAREGGCAETRPALASFFDVQTINEPGSHTFADANHLELMGLIV